MLAREWFSAREFAELELPGLPASERGVQKYAEGKDWQAADREGTQWRRRAGRGGGIEFHYSLLRSAAQVALVMKLVTQPAAPQQDDARDARWDWFERLSAPKRNRARHRLKALDAVAALQRSGSGKVVAMQLVAAEFGVQLSTLYAWEERTFRIERHDWLPYLADGYVGGSTRADCPAEAWDMLRADYLRPERPTFRACFRRLERVAATRGWVLPSARTLERRLQKIPEATQIAARHGTEDLKRLYPAQRRTRAHFHALQAVNADGHKWDVFVRWPDGEITRPIMLAWQDLYSGKLLSWRLAKTENKETTRLSFGDLVENYGIPDAAWLDNGRQFASKWITGGAPNRYRFKVRDEDPLGLLTELGVAVHWTTPYSGQSKPIERMFRDFASDVAKHPAFAGAYVGNKPDAKPENYGSAAVPFEQFERILAGEITAHNARQGRQSAVCAGRSFDDVFAESYERAPIRKASAAQRRLWLLAAEGVLCSRENGSITLAGNRFWAEFLVPLRGTRVVARFDPQALQDDLTVYSLAGALLGTAPCLEAVGFDDVDAAREHARARKAWMRAQKAALAAERKLSISDVAAMLPANEPPSEPRPAARVVRGVFGSAVSAAEAEERSEEEDREFFAAVRRNAERLRLVRDEEV